MGIDGRFRWARISFVSGLLLGGSRARAQPSPAPDEPPLRVLWTSEDPECDGDDVAARALRLVTPGVVPRPLRASVEVRRQGPLWVVRLETRSGEQTGYRNLQAESCREIEDALALLLAMTLESKLDPAPPPEPSPPPATTAPVAPPPAAPPPAGSPAPPPSEDEPALTEPPPDDGPGLFRGVFVRASGKAGWLQQPGLALGAAAAVGVRLGDFELGVGGTYWPSTSEPITEIEDARLFIRRQNIGLRACWNAWRAGNFVVAPCVSPEAVLFQVKSEGLVRVSSESVDPRFSLGASAELRYEAFGGALAFSLGAGISVEQPQPFTVRPIIEQDEMDENVPPPEPPEVYTTKAIGPRLEIGIDARF